MAKNRKAASKSQREAQKQALGADLLRSDMLHHSFSLQGRTAQKSDRLSPVTYSGCGGRT